MNNTNTPVSPDTTPELVLFTGHSGSVAYLAFLRDGRTLASAGSDRSVILWNAETGEMLSKLQHPDPDFWWEGISDDGIHAIASDSQGLSIWSTGTGTAEPRPGGWAARSAMSPDGRYLAACGWEDGSLVLVTYPEQQIVLRMDCVSDSVPDSICFSPDGRIVAVQPGVGPVLLCDLRTSKRHLLAVPGAEDAAIEELSFSPDSQLLVATTPSGIGVWRASSGEYVRTLQVRCRQVCIAFSPDGGTVASGDDEGVLTFWDTGSWTPSQLRRAHRGEAKCATFSHDGNLLATGGDDRRIRVWDARTGELLRSLRGHERRANSVAFTPDGRALLSGNGDGTIRVWDAGSQHLSRTITAGSGPTVGLSVSRDGTLLAALVQNTRRRVDSELVVWDWKADIPQERLPAYGAPNSIAFAPGGELLYQADNRTVVVRNLAARRTRLSVRGCRPVAVSPKGGVFAAGNLLGKSTGCLAPAAGLGSLASGRFVHNLSFCSETGGIDEPISAAFSPSGQVLALGHLGFGVSLWSVQTGDLMGLVEAWRDSVCALAFSPDGRTLAIGTDYDDIVQLFSTHTLREKRRLIGHTNNVNSLAFSPDGKALASASSDGSIKLWNPRTGRLLSTLLILPAGHDDEVSLDWIAYTPEGHWHGSPGAERFVRWRVGNDYLPASEYAAPRPHR